MDGRGSALSGTGAEMAEVLALGLFRQTQEQFPVNRHQRVPAAAMFGGRCPPYISLLRLCGTI